jgi:hypothetical protein
MSVQFQDENLSYTPSSYAVSSPESELPFVVRTTMRISGGLIKTPRQAVSVLAGLCLLMVAGALFLTYRSTRYSTPSAKSHEEQEREQLREYIATHPQS